MVPNLGPFVLGGLASHIKASEKGDRGVLETNEPLHSNSGWREKKQHVKQKANWSAKKAFEYSKNA